MTPCEHGEVHELACIECIETTAHGSGDAEFMKLLDEFEEMLLDEASSVTANVIKRRTTDDDR